jgi:hypothetical protein
MPPTRGSGGELAAGVSGLALFAFMFLPWYGGEVTLQRLGAASLDNLDAWQAFSVIDLVLFAAAALAVAHAVARLAGFRPAGGAVPPDIIVAIGGTVALLLIAYRLIDPPTASGIGVEVDLSRKLGIYLSLLAAAGITCGGFTALNARAAVGGPD